MSFNINKFKLLLIEYLYVFIAILSIPVLIFRNIWFMDLLDSVYEPYLSLSLFNTYSLIVFCIIIVSIVLIFRLNYKFAYILGIISSNLTVLDYIFTLRRYGLQLYSDISYYYLVIILGITLINIVLIVSNYHSNEKQNLIIKKLLLDFGTKYSQLEIKDISEKVSMNRSKVKRVIIKMIDNNEIYARYLRDKNLIEFNKNLNIEEIDNLMKNYQNWEDTVYGKKIF